MTFSSIFETQMTDDCKIEPFIAEKWNLFSKELPVDFHQAVKYSG